MKGAAVVLVAVLATVQVLLVVVAAAATSRKDTYQLDTSGHQQQVLRTPDSSHEPGYSLSSPHRVPGDDTEDTGHFKGSGGVAGVADVPVSVRGRGETQGTRRGGWNVLNVGPAEENYDPTLNLNFGNSDSEGNSGDSSSGSSSSSSGGGGGKSEQFSIMQHAKKTPSIVASSESTAEEMIRQSETVRPSKTKLRSRFPLGPGSVFRGVLGKGKDKIRINSKITNMLLPLGGGGGEVVKSTVSGSGADSDVKDGGDESGGDKVVGDGGGVDNGIHDGVVLEGVVHDDGDRDGVLDQDNGDGNVVKDDGGDGSVDAMVDVSGGGAEIVQDGTENVEEEEKKLEEEEEEEDDEERQVEEEKEEMAEKAPVEKEEEPSMEEQKTEEETQSVEYQQQQQQQPVEAGSVEAAAAALDAALGAAVASEGGGGGCEAVAAAISDLVDRLLAEALRKYGAAALQRRGPGGSRGRSLAAALARSLSGGEGGGVDGAALADSIRSFVRGTLAAALPSRGAAGVGGARRDALTSGTQSTPSGASLVLPQHTSDEPERDGGGVMSPSDIEAMIRNTVYEAMHAAFGGGLTMALTDPQEGGASEGAGLRQQQAGKAPSGAATRHRGAPRARRRRGAPEGEEDERQQEEEEETQDEEEAEELPEPAGLAWVDPSRLVSQGARVQNVPSLANLVGLRLFKYQFPPPRPATAVTTTPRPAAHAHGGDLAPPFGDTFHDTFDRYYKTFRRNDGPFFPEAASGGGSGVSEPFPPRPAPLHAPPRPAFPSSSAADALLNMLNPLNLFGHNQFPQLPRYPHPASPPLPPPNPTHPRHPHRHPHARNTPTDREVFGGGSGGGGDIKYEVIVNEEAERQRGYQYKEDYPLRDDLYVGQDGHIYLRDDSTVTTTLPPAPKTPRYHPSGRHHDDHDSFLREYSKLLQNHNLGNNNYLDDFDDPDAFDDDYTSHDYTDDPNTYTHYSYDDHHHYRTPRPTFSPTFSPTHSPTHTYTDTPYDLWTPSYRQQRGPYNTYAPHAPAGPYAPQPPRAPRGPSSPWSLDSGILGWLLSPLSRPAYPSYFHSPREVQMPRFRYNIGHPRRYSTRPTISAPSHPQHIPRTHTPRLHPTRPPFQPASQPSTLAPAPAPVTASAPPRSKPASPPADSEGRNEGFYPGNGFFDSDFPTLFHMTASEPVVKVEKPPEPHTTSTPTPTTKAP